jgi:hypothetical protein
MISNLRELQVMLLNKASLENNTSFKRRYLMVTPGSTTERLQLLYEVMINMPLSYTNIISNYSVNGVAIDGFSLSPYSYKNKDTVEGLLEAYEDPFFPKEFMEKHRMYQIGSYNTDILCVTAGTDQFKEGEILYIEEGYDIYNPEDSQIRKIAKDFEQFLIVAGNLEEIHTEMGGDESLYEQKRQEFIDRFNKLGVSEEYHKAWLWVF